jgi:hypothetical protein
MRRQPAHLLAVVDESALRRNISGSAVMLDQLRALDEPSRWGNVEVRIVPVTAGNPQRGTSSDWPPVILAFHDLDRANGCSHRQRSPRPISRRLRVFKGLETSLTISLVLCLR